MSVLKRNSCCVGTSVTLALAGDLGKYGSNNGYDVVAFKGTLDNPTEILIVEGKQFKQGKIAEFDDIANASGYDSPSGLTINPNNSNTGLPTQNE